MRQPDTESPSPPINLPSSVGPRAMNRVQLFARFLGDRFSDVAPAAPPAGHVPSLSLPHLWAEMDIETPLLCHAIDTLCLTDTASKSPCTAMAYAAAAARGRTYGMLHRAIALHQSKPPTRSSRDIVLTIICISLTAALGSEAELDDRHSQATAHLEGALRFLAANGPSFLIGGDKLDAVLLRHIQMYCLPVGLARRKEFIFQTPEWQRVPRVLLHDDLNVYKASGYIRAQSLPTKSLRWHHEFETSTDRNLHRDMLGPIPKLLEVADNFVKGYTGDAEQLQAMSHVVRRADHTLETSVGPAMDDAFRVHEPHITNDHTDAFDPAIEEHAFLRTSAFVREHFQFVSPMCGYASANMYLLSLMTDCTLLQIICCGIEHGLSPEWTGVHKDDVEERASANAFGLCQHVYFYSQRSLTAAIFLRLMVAGARNYFESIGQVDATEWCDACLDANSLRIERLQLTTTSLCPVVATFPRIAEGFKIPNYVP